MIKFILFEIGITKFQEIRQIILCYLKNIIKTNYLRVFVDNIEVYDIEEFDIEYWFSEK